ncbi:MAG TPA: Hint domain-containing protein [Acetobacteraceae bacterium]|nr:Hint domain-containing protein [Acetobacteraceae bacterium]
MATDTWTGADNTWDLEDPKNWSSGSVPGAGDTAVFNGGTLNLSSGPVPSIQAQPFAPSVVSVANAASVTFGQGYEVLTFTFPVLDIIGNSTVAFSGDALIAGTVRDQGVLDISQGLPFGNVPKHPVSEQAAVSWSAAHGFGSVALAGVVQHMTIEPTGTYVTPSVSGADPTVVMGAIRYGDNNLAAGTLQFGGPGDLPHTTPAFPGTGGVYDVISPAGLGSVAPGFAPVPDPYAALLASSVPCFRAGTMILTADGERAVERLRPGDVVLTASGRRATLRWVGQRTVRVTAASAPVRLRADAIADGVPRRDLFLSPDHAVLVDGVLVPARLLANGATIRRDATRARVTYVHLELDRHDLLLAEGLAAESYLDTGNRAQFDRAAGVRPLRPDGARAGDALQATRAAYRAQGCAPFHAEGEVARAAHARLLWRAQALGWRLTEAALLSVSAGDRLGADCYLLPAGTIRLRSRAFVPAELDAASGDGRLLGVAVAADLPDDAWRSGWHAAEGGWRWTDGDAVLALTRPATIRLIACGGRYWAGRRAVRRGRARGHEIMSGG